MATNYYLPRGEDKKVTWLNTFSENLPVHAATVGVTGAEVTATTDDAAMFAYQVKVSGIFVSEKESRVSYKNLLAYGKIGTVVGGIAPVPVLPVPPNAVPAGIFPRVTLLVARIKKHPNYNESIGKDLGIIGAEQDDNTDKMQPALKVVLKGGKPEIMWKKAEADALYIEVDRDRQGWKFLAVDTEPDYTDTAAITAPAMWKYRAIYLISDEKVGKWSDIASIAVS